MFQLIQEHKRLTYKFNRAFGLLVAVFVVYGSPYYSLHFVDMFEIKGLMNQLSMFTFVAMLGLCCKWAIDILLKVWKRDWGLYTEQSKLLKATIRYNFQAQRRKRWLVKNSQRFMQMHRHDLAMFLDDLTWEKYGLGSYYIVNKYVAGQVNNCM